MGVKNIIGELQVNGSKVVTEEALDETMQDVTGDIDATLDSIIAIQEELINSKTYIDEYVNTALGGDY
jgi:hypothetical protein